MPSGETLLPCPFCGGPAQSYDDEVMANRWWVECYQCQASLSHEDEAQAIAAWNRRVAHQERDADARRLHPGVAKYALRRIGEAIDFKLGDDEVFEIAARFIDPHGIEPDSLRDFASEMMTIACARAIDAAMAPDTQTHYPPNAWHKPAAEDLEGGSDG